MGTPVPGNGKRPAAWSNEDKFLAVVATASMNQAEIAEYCRSKGIYAQELQSWRRACIEGQEKMTLREDTKALKDALEKERKRTKDVERELLRKDKALAETAALLALRKKLRRSGGKTRTLYKPRRSREIHSLGIHLLPNPAETPPAAAPRVKRKESFQDSHHP